MAVVKRSEPVGVQLLTEVMGLLEVRQRTVSMEERASIDARIGELSGKFMAISGGGR